MDLERVIADKPKAELHVHIEGTLEPELMFTIAQRNGIEVPYASAADLRAAYDFANLQDFLDLYYTGVNALQHAEDFEELTTAYLQRARAENIRHIEFFFDPQAHTARGISPDVFMGGFKAACQRAQQQGITAKMIMCFLRHLSEADAFATLEQMQPYLANIIGVGLDSSELGHPPEKFARVFEEARGLGLRLVAHAGEEGPPEYVWQALDVLGVDRIDHGNRALEDEALVARLVSERMPLTVCPLSNLKLCVVDDLVRHPLKTMLEQDLLVTVNSDDPAYFGGYLNDNFMAVSAALGLTETDITTLIDNSFQAAF
jgi:adenosine deaminase